MLIKPSIIHTYPQKTPDSIADIVLFPNKVFFSLSSDLREILGNLDVDLYKDSIDKLTPGEIIPPKYAPPFPITSKVVAVPKSIIIAGSNFIFLTANALISLSCPASFGFCILI